MKKAPKPPTKRKLIQNAFKQLYTDDPGSFTGRWMKLDSILTCLNTKYPFNENYNCDLKAALSVLPKSR